MEKVWQTIEYVYDERSGLYRKLKTTEVMPFAAVFAEDRIAERLIAALPCPSIRVKTSRELLSAAAKPGVVVFIESDYLCYADAAVTRVPVVAIMNDSPEVLQRMVRSIEAFPWLSHFMAETMLHKPIARSHVGKLIEHIVMGVEHCMLGTRGYGRVALLARASQREARFERMRMLFGEHGVSGRTIDRISEVYEELVTNALYDAPFEGGYFRESVPRTHDVEMPKARACEVSYGVENEIAYIRVRDTFGALTRARLFSVLTRCNTTEVALDETRGGAGLGLWRVFSAASTVSITVNPGQLTEFVVGIPIKDKRAGLLSVDLAFAASSIARPDVDDALFDHSVTLVSAS